MRFVADESCDFAAVRALRAVGHKVVAIAEIAPAADDEHVLQLATRRNSVLLTEDKDFGQLVFAARRATARVILIRFPISARAALGDASTDLVGARGRDLLSSYVVLQPGRIRIVRSLTTRTSR